MSVYYVGSLAYDSDYLAHFGIKGQKWGIRRYQNEDGTLTPAGKARYGTETEKMAAKDAQRMSDAKAAYGEGAGVRRKLLTKEIDQKMKSKEYAKAYKEAEKNVSVSKSLKRAEKLHKNSGTFVRGRSLADSGYKHSRNVLNTAGSIAVTALTTGFAMQAFTSPGDKMLRKIMLAGAATASAASIAKAGRDAYSYHYYEKNKRF